MTINQKLLWILVRCFSVRSSAMRIPTSSASYTVWYAGLPRLAGEIMPVGKWLAAAPIPSSGMREPSEKFSTLVGLALVNGDSCESTKNFAASLFGAISEVRQGWGCKGLTRGLMRSSGTGRERSVEEGLWRPWWRFNRWDFRGVTSASLAREAAGLESGRVRRWAIAF